MGESSERFSGFPDSPMAFTPLPSAFFSRLLPRIDDIGELKVTLHLFWLLHRQKGEARFARWEELLADRTLMTGLGGGPTPPGDALAQALESAVARGTILSVVLEGPAGEDRLYFLNTGEGRRTAARLRQGDLVLPPPARRAFAEPVVATRSALSVLYEQQISLLTPSVAAGLARAEADYGAAAVAAAIGEAVRYEKRRWAYVRRVLENGVRGKGGKAGDGQED